MYGELTIGAAFIDEINVLLSAPQANLILDQTDFYDSTAAFTWGINFGVLFPIATKWTSTLSLASDMFPGSLRWINSSGRGWTRSMTTALA